MQSVSVTFVPAAVVGVGDSPLDVQCFGQELVAEPAAFIELLAENERQLRVGERAQLGDAHRGDRRRQLGRPPLIGEAGVPQQPADCDLGVPNRIGIEVLRVLLGGQVHARDAGNGVAVLVDDVWNGQLGIAEQFAERLDAAGRGRCDQPGVAEGDRDATAAAVHDLHIEDGRTLRRRIGAAQDGETAFQPAEVAEGR